MTHVKTMEAAKIMEDVDTMATNQVTAFKEDTLHKKKWELEQRPRVILHITVGHMEFVPIWVNNSGPQQISTKSTRYSITKYWVARETASDRSGQ